MLTARTNSGTTFGATTPSALDSDSRAEHRISHPERVAGSDGSWRLAPYSAICRLALYRGRGAWVDRYWSVDAQLCQLPQEPSPGNGRRYPRVRPASRIEPHPFWVLSIFVMSSRLTVHLQRLKGPQRPTPVPKVRASAVTSIHANGQPVTLGKAPGAGAYRRLHLSRAFRDGLTIPIIMHCGAQNVSASS